MSYTKYDDEEDIQVGDTLSIINDKVTKSLLNDNNKLLGICSKINEDNTIEVVQEGIIDVNVEGFIGGIGTALTISDKESGKLHQIPQDVLELQQYNLPIIGRVIGIYNVYDKVQIIIDNRSFM